MISAIALDLGTTSIKAGLLDRNGVLSHLVAHPAPKIGANGGRYESDALAYAALADQALGECIAHAGECRSLGLCSQRSSFLIWEHAGGKPLTPLISWQDNRGAASCETLRAQENSIRELAGLPLTPYYFAPKLRAVLQEKRDWRTRLERGELLAGTLDSFMIWRWTGGRHFVTDASMAARTLLADIRRQQWSPQLCELFGIPLSRLPGIIPSAGMGLQLDNGLTLQSSVGDQSAALFASVSGARAEALVNLGTGCFVVRYLPDEESTLSTRHEISKRPFVLSLSKHECPHGLRPAQSERNGISICAGSTDGYLRTLVYQDVTHHAHFAIEGTLNSIAAALAPYPLDECRLGDAVTRDIYCVAEPSGLGAPYFRGDIGIRFSRPVGHLTQRQIAGLLLEAVIFRVARILEDFHRLSPLERVYLSGGLSELTCLQQGIARCVPFAVHRLVQAESSLRGAALLAAGMAPAYNRKSDRIHASGNADALPEKYRHWKQWLDDLLVS